MTGPTRILYCETNVDGTIGGSYFSLLYLIQGLDKRRFRPTALFYADHGLLPAFREAGAETIVWPRTRSFSFATTLPAGLRWLRVPALTLQKGLNLVRGYVGPTLARARFLSRHDFRIVHLNNSIKYNHDWMAAARLTRRICVCHERGINDDYSAAARYFGRRLDAIVSISQAVTANMRQRGVGFPNLITVHNGLNPDTLSFRRCATELRAQLGIAADDLVVVMVGNLKAWKGQHTVVRAMDRVRRTFPCVRCVFVGATAAADREYERSLRQLVAELGLEPHVLFAGYTPDVPDFLAMSDIVVHASVSPEPFGRVILEAMACRKPVIGARGGAITELVLEGETGLTFPPDDDEALAGAILMLVGNPERRRRMGCRGYERLVREFHIRRNVEATERLYHRLMSGAN
jgi:glycosyltransferase involved in cell wall biosynthesis